MARSRLSTAIAGQGLVLPDGPVRVLRPPAAWDLSALDAARVEIAHGFLPDLTAWRGRGYADAGQGQVPTVLVIVPRSKTLARALLVQALDQAGGMVIVDGQKTDGVDSLFKACRGWADIEGSVTQNHGRLFWFRPGARPDWTVTPQIVDGLITVPGVFSEGKVDLGSALLADALPPLSGRAADFGAGWGYLSRAILRSPAITSLDMIEAERLALDCLTQNIADPRARAIWADATGHAADQPYETIVINPPFHDGRTGTPDLGRAFLRNAARNLVRSGTLWLVANRHLPYEGDLAALFKEVAEIGGDGRFKLIRAVRPKG